MKSWWLYFPLCLRLAGRAQKDVNKLTQSGKVSLVIPCIPGKQWSIVLCCQRIIGGGDRREGAAPEVAAAEHGDGRVLGDPLDEVAPLARQLDGNLPALHPLT